ncbi:MAG: fimbrillin family protein, partial [Muribaculaceae bacterium]|nr:fimbrillin family protein [Muribaculaceae bacterium]
NDTDGSASSRTAEPNNGTIITAISQFEGDIVQGDSLFLIIEESDIDNAPVDNSIKSRTVLGANQYYNSASISAFKYKSGTWDGSANPDFIYDMKLSQIGDSWEQDGAYKWPGAAFGLRFFGVSPYGVGTLSAIDHKGFPTLDYTVPQKVSDQISLLTFFTDEIAGNYKNTVQLNLKHATASIYLYETDYIVPGTIKSISLKNFYGSGTYDYQTDKWTNLRDNTDYTQELSKELGGTDGNEITDHLTAFTILPQDMQETSALEIVYTDNYWNVERVLTAKLKGRFEAGKRYNLSISPNSFRREFILEIDGVKIPLEGSNQKPVYIDFPLDNTTLYKKFTFATKIIREGEDDTYIPLEKDDWTSINYKYNLATDKYDIQINTR